MHKLHMIWYLMATPDKYNILYMEHDGEILSYIIFLKANNRIINECTQNDYYTIFLWTYPEHRGKGLATMMAKTMLHDLGLHYSHFYKTINKDNVASACVAKKSGFVLKCDSIKSKYLHTIYKANEGTQYLYCFDK